MIERRDPKTLEEAYLLRDSAGYPEERDFYQEKVYALRRAEYQRRGIPTASSFRRRQGSPEVVAHKRTAGVSLDGAPAFS